MNAKSGQVVTLVGHFVASGAAATGLTGTGKGWELRTDGSKVPNDTTGTALTVAEIGGGAYKATYTMTGDGVPLAVFTTEGTADVKSVPASAISLEMVAADLRQMGGVAQSATDLKDFADSGYDPATHKVQGVVLVDTTTTNADMRGTDGANTTEPDNASIAAIKAKTDSLTFTTPNKVDTSAEAIIAAADIRSAVGLAGANLDEQLDAIIDAIPNAVRPGWVRLTQATLDTDGTPVGTVAPGAIVTAYLKPGQTITVGPSEPATSVGAWYLDVPPDGLWRLKAEGADWDHTDVEVQT
jgi:hypothetical protein